MGRRAPPPDFRYVWLMPGPGSLAVTLGAVGAAIAATGTAVWTSGHAVTVGVVAGGSAVVAAAQRARLRVPRHAREVAMAIVPWGIVVEPDSEPRVLRWPAVRRVTVEVASTMQGGTPSIVASVVTVDTGRELYAGRAMGAVGLEGLTVNLDAYTEEAARPVALDLSGNEPATGGATEPVVAELCARAEVLCTTGRGAAELGLPPGGYRSIASASAGPETVALLRAILASDGANAPADARPLAAFVAAMVGATSLTPDLLRLTSSPHPMVAAAARASAIRLGTERRRAGAIAEVAAFLFDEDLDGLTRWAGERDRDGPEGALISA
jgi:hypothetical protein